jgi:GcrA cell cycle regulator
MWTYDEVLQLKTFWFQGLSTAEIGRRMGVSKNAIVGKAHRLDLDARPSPIRRDHAPARIAPARPQLPRLAELAPLTSCTPEPIEHPARPAPTQTRPNPRVRRTPVAIGNTSCCWPIGDPGTPSFRFCNTPNEAGKPYCPKHCVTAYRGRKGDEAAA